MSISSLAPRENIAAGIGWMLATVFCFMTLDALAKYLLQYFPTSQVLWARFFFQMVIAVAVMWPTLPASLRSGNLRLQLIRSVLLLVTTLLFFLGLKTVPLATAASISFLTPIFVTVLSIPLLGEKVGPRRWTGVLIGFAGALVIVRPGIAGISAGMLFLLACSFTNALYQIVTRLIRHHDSAETTFFYTAVAGAAVYSLAAPFDWQPPGGIEWVLLLGLGIAGGLGHYCLIRAFRLAPAAVLSSFAYTGLLWATAFGFAIFGELPDLWTLLGASLIIGSGLYIFHRESRVNSVSPASDGAVR
jgi:drug/metabolite transporter (DMT)-like permease